jgi:hypothetical protein
MSILHMCLTILNELTHTNTFLHCSLFVCACKQMHISRTGIIFFSCTCKHINTAQKTLTPTQQPPNVPFRNYIPSRFTLSVLPVRFTAHSRNGKLYLSSGTAPCKLETDDVRIHLSRISLCRFWIVKTCSLEAPDYLPTRSEHALKYRQQADTSPQNRRK